VIFKIQKENMKNLCLVLCLAGMIAATNVYASFDGTVVLSQGANSFSDGGEFTAVTTGLGTFQTFCIELNQEFGPGNTYQYNENTGAVTGDGGVDATDLKTGLPMDNISIGTAWLYSQFRGGTLPNYFNSYRQQNAGALQDSIWYLENEITLSQLQNGFNGASASAAEAFVANAATQTGTTWNSNTGLGTVFNDSKGAYGVIALNLFNGAYGQPVTSPNGTTYNLNQDQLAIVPEPTTMVAGALLLLPFGASTLRILRKSRKA
jgi:hypothetical protein